MQESLQAAGRLTNNNLRGEQVTRYCDEHRHCGGLSRSVVVLLLVYKLNSVALSSSVLRVVQHALIGTSLGVEKHKEHVGECIYSACLISAQNWTIGMFSNNWSGCCSLTTASTAQCSTTTCQGFGFFTVWSLSSREAYFAACHNYKHILCNKGTLPGFVIADRIYENCSYHLILD